MRGFRIFLGAMVEFYLLPVLAVSVCLIGMAMAAEMTGAELKDFHSGKTLYAETTTASAGGYEGSSILYFAPDGTVLYRWPNHAIMHGTWSIKGNTLCTDWKEAPNTPCRKYDKQGDTVTVTNIVTGRVVAKILKTAPGNAENLEP